MATYSSKGSGNFTDGERFLALTYGAISIGFFFAAVAVMILSLYRGLQCGFGRFTGWYRLTANAILLLQFPLLHSVLLSRRGRSWLNVLAPTSLSRHLQPTNYVLVASMQILAVFLLWSPGGTPLWEPQGIVRWLHNICFLAAWVLLGKSMWDAHLGVQMGYIGWLSVWRRHAAIPWPDLPTRGVFRICRQPIYFSFMLTLWTGPTWTIDKICTAAVWTLYCFVGPYFKEQRLLQTFGARFNVYRSRVPYWPWMNRSLREDVNYEDQR